ncbi:MAG: DUF2232 domain-containing protein [Erysipelotrichaceae bacterium]
MHNKIRVISEAGMMCALMALLLLVNKITGNSLEFYFNYLLPIPIIIYGIKYDMRSDFALCFAIIVIGVLFGSLTTLIYLLVACVIGFVFAYGVKKEKSSIYLIVITMIFTGISYYLSYILLANIFGFDIGGEIAIIDRFLMGLNINGVWGLSNYHIAYFIELMTISVMSFFESLIVYMVSYILLKKFKIVSLNIAELLKMRLSKGFIAFNLVLWLVFLLLIVVKYEYNMVFYTLFFVLSYVNIVVVIDGFFVGIKYIALSKKKKLLLGYIILIILVPINLIVFYGLGLFNALKRK